MDSGLDLDYDFNPSGPTACNPKKEYISKTLEYFWNFPFYILTSASVISYCRNKRDCPQ